MEPFFFSEQGRKLLGLYHPPAGFAKDSGVLICPPLFGEYMRTHGCLRQLAIELAALGHHVLRFDYSGTGDSAGDIQDASVSNWLEDICAAAKELQAISGIANVALAGVRLGAALAVSAASECRAVRRVILWDPVDDGTRYLQGLNDTYEALIASHENLAPADVEAARNSTTGYALTEPLLQSIGSLRIEEACRAQANRLFVLLTDKASFDSGYWQKRTPNCQFFEYDCNWPTFSESVVFGRSLIKELVGQV
jgi:pimeloyl-ACP methyl ester carboxylesterase